MFSLCLAHLLTRRVRAVVSFCPLFLLILQQFSLMSFNPHKLFILVSHQIRGGARVKWSQNRLFIARVRNGERGKVRKKKKRTTLKHSEKDSLNWFSTILSIFLTLRLEAVLCTLNDATTIFHYRSHSDWWIEVPPSNCMLLCVWRWTTVTISLLLLTHLILDARNSINCAQP